MSKSHGWRIGVVHSEEVEKDTVRGGHLMVIDSSRRWNSRASGGASNALLVIPWATSQLAEPTKPRLSRRVMLSTLARR